MSSANDRSVLSHGCLCMASNVASAAGQVAGIEFGGENLLVGILMLGRNLGVDGLPGVHDLGICGGKHLGVILGVDRDRDGAEEEQEDDV